MQVSSLSTSIPHLVDRLVNFFRAAILSFSEIDRGFLKESDRHAPTMRRVRQETELGTSDRPARQGEIPGRRRPKDHRHQPATL